MDKITKNIANYLKKPENEGMRDDRDLWNEWFDGSGLKGWWD